MAAWVAMIPALSTLALGPVGKALYSGPPSPPSPLQTGGRCLLYTEARTPSLCVEGACQPTLLLLGGIAEFRQHRRHWPFFVVLWGQ